MSKTRAKAILEVELPEGKSLNDFNELILAALGHYVREKDQTWATLGFQSVETKVEK